MYYAIGDVHGQYDLLRKLYTKILAHAVASGDERNVIVFLGDYIDRGPKNVQVLDFIKNLENSDGLEHVRLRGNHEEIFIDAMENPQSRFHRDMWINNGGNAFLRETGYSFEQFVHTFHWDHYVRWFKIWLEDYYETEDYIFVHGGLDIRKPNMKEQDGGYMRWARHTQRDWYRTFPKMVIHGHTPNADPQIDNNRVNVDTAYSYSKYPTLRLTAVALPMRRYESHLEPEFLQVHSDDG